MDSSPLAFEGVIVTRQGKGSWVNDTLDLKRLQRDELIQHLEQAGKLAKLLAISEDKMLQMIKQYME